MQDTSACLWGWHDEYNFLAWTSTQFNGRNRSFLFRLINALIEEKHKNTSRLTRGSKSQGRLLWRI